MLADDIDALFALAKEAKQQALVECGEDEPDEDGTNIFENAPCKVRKGTPTITRLDDGDYHVCYGVNCQHLILDKERQWVCTITGLVIGTEHARDGDPAWTGRSTSSANPDDTAGTPAGGWSKRRDMYAASIQAHRNAHNISIDEVVFDDRHQKNQKTEKNAVKRGALCVDELPNEELLAKRQRSSKRDVWTADAISKLTAEAISVIDKLIVAENNAPPSASSSASSSTPNPTTKPLDPRLQNVEFVRAVALRKYVRACAEGRQSLNLDVIHNVCIVSNEFVRRQRQQAALQNAASVAAVKNATKKNACFSGQIRNLTAKLIVALWRAACACPYMKEGKKSGDSFRPFSAGCLYALKRGLYLKDGTCLIPELEVLAAFLPALRSQSASVAAKQLQSSSHRGLCSLHKSIASMEEMQDGEDAAHIRSLFHDAAHCAAFLRELVYQNV